MREWRFQGLQDLTQFTQEQRQDLNPSSLSHGPESACKVLLVVTEASGAVNARLQPALPVGTGIC